MGEDADSKTPVPALAWDGAKSGGTDSQATSARTTDIEVAATSPTSPSIKFEAGLREKLGGIVNGDKRQGAVLLKELGGAETVAAKVFSSPEAGLSSEEERSGFVERRAVFGINRLPPPPSKSLWILIKEALEERIMQMLIVAAAISIVLGVVPPFAEPGGAATGWYEGAAILIAVTIVVLVGSINDFQKEQQFRALNDKETDKPVTVIRGGLQKQVSVFDIVVGDVVVLAVGDIVATDGALLAQSNLKMDESSATGEPDNISKTLDSDPIMITGTRVVDGQGRYLVTAVGETSFGGQISMSLRKPRDDTPLQRRLAVLANDIGKVGLIAAVFTLVVLVIKWLLTHTFSWPAFTTVLVAYLITAITIVVLAVPEGLPLAVTISLAYSMVKMLKDNNLVRQLQACETMGSATTICSDKTGTLTQNKMTVVAGWLAQEEFGRESPVKSGSLPKITESLLIDNISINSTAYEAVRDDGTVDRIGNKTEWALLTFARDLGFDFASVRKRLTPVVHHVYPFSSARKRMSTVVALPDGQGYRMFVKGASEIVLARSIQYLNETGNSVELSSDTRALMTGVIEKLASDALRTLTLAYRDYGPDGVADWEAEDLDSGLTLIGMVGIQDPLRPEAAAAVAQCQTAGILVRMVTGDNAITAKNIARNCGIYHGKHGIVIEGPVFRDLTDDQVDAVLPNIQVMARCSPLDKQRLVERLKASGEVVAVTGDGTNDAPALQTANVGFAMNIAGTDIAKEAAAVVLMDDNFASIVRAVLWGRNVYDAIRKFVQFQLTVNVAAVSLAFIGAVSDAEGESPLTPVQLLWLNLIMDTLGALALATDSPSADMIERPPVQPKDPLISQYMWRNILGQSVYQIIIQLWILYFGPEFFGLNPDDPEEHRIHLSIFFSAFVMCQVFNEINCRKVHGEWNVFEGITRNKLFLNIITVIVVIQVAMVQFFGDFAQTRPLTLTQWLWATGIGALSLPIYLIVQLVPISWLGCFAANVPFRSPDAIAAANAANVAHFKAKRRGSLDAGEPRSPWQIVRNVRTQLGVINALRKYKY